MQTSIFYPQAGVSIEEHFSEKSSIVLHTGDTLDFLNTIPNETISLVVSSPPYNLGKEYETKQSIISYLQEQARVVEQLKRVLADEGSICWQVGNYVDKGEVFPLDIFYYK